MARVLVTGGSGFIGSHIVAALAARGDEPVVLDLDPPRADAPPAEHLLGDVRDADTVRAALAGVELVCHQAAKVGLGVDLGDLPDYVSHNELGTAVLLRALAELPAAARPRRFVLASSMVVYGEGGYACPADGAVRPLPRAPDDLAAGRFEPRCPRCGAPLEPQPIPERAALDPRNVYAATKLGQEHLTAVWSRETGIPATLLRYHNVYGPRMPRDTPYAGVAALFADAIAAGRPPRVFEDGRQRRDFVHVRDVARANVLALTAAEPVTGPLNVCSGTPRTVGELAGALHDAAGRPPGTAPVVTGEFRLGDVRHVFADPARARAALGFAAAEPFAGGLAELAGELGLGAAA